MSRYRQILPFVVGVISGTGAGMVMTAVFYGSDVAAWVGVGCFVVAFVVLGVAYGRDVYGKGGAS